jgi:translation elongation factor EF-1beta
MRPAFGFSVGDFVSAPGTHRSLIPLNLKLLLSLTKLVRKITNGLQKTAGASSQYQHIFHGLNALYIILQLLEQIEPTEEHASHLNAIRGMALAC